jgi:Ca2+-binding EF-hand superfamily protein
MTRPYFLLPLVLLTACARTAGNPPTQGGKPASAPDLRQSALRDRIMAAADKDKDGRLSLAEFKTLDVQALHHGDAHFAQGDANHDGAIDGDELPGALRKQTWFAILSEGTEACFRRLDSDQDAGLDVKEFRPISKMGAHTEQHFRGADADQDARLSLGEFTGLAERKLRALETESTRRR